MFSDCENGIAGSSGLNTGRTNSTRSPEIRALKLVSRQSNLESIEASSPSSPKKRHESLYSRHQRILKRMKYNEEEPNKNIALAQSLDLHQQPFSAISNMQPLQTNHSKDTLA